MSYWDSSALASLYVSDAHSAAAAAALERSKGAVLLTEFHQLEIANAIQLRVFHRELKPPEAAAIRAAFASDRLAGRFRIAPLPPSLFTSAARLATTHSARFGVRSLDLLHLAAALELNASVFFSFDSRQLRLARALGLKLAQ